MNNTDLARITNETEILDRMSYACDEYWEFRYYVANKRTTSPETLERLSYDKESAVRYSVLQNPNTPQYIKDLYKFKTYLRSMDLML